MKGKALPSLSLFQLDNSHMFDPRISGDVPVTLVSTAAIIGKQILNPGG